MITNKHTGEQNTETRKELAARYFGGLEMVYGEGNMGIVSLLSDVQETIARSERNPQTAEHYRVILNDIKCILIRDDRVERLHKDLADDGVVRIVGREVSNG